MYEKVEAVRANIKARTQIIPIKSKKLNKQKNVR